MNFNKNLMDKCGCINLILGPMYSSKSTTLSARLERYGLGGKKCVAIKYKNDTRYSKDKIMTHKQVPLDIFTIVCQNLYEADELISEYDVIGVDEVQFYKDAHIFCDKWANQGKIVEACGLSGTFERKPFEVVTKLIPLAQNITFNTAVCKTNGCDAIYSKRISDENEEELIGGDDKYCAVDRITYFNDNYEKTYVNSFKEFLTILSGINNQKMSDEDSQILVNNFIEKNKNNFNHENLKHINFKI